MDPNDLDNRIDLDKQHDFSKYNFDNTSVFTLNGVKLKGRLVDIIDGDSLTIILPLFGSYYKYNVRIMGIDTCEIKSKNDENKLLALEARCELLRLITNDPSYISSLPKSEIRKILHTSLFIVDLECYDFDKYGRLLADIYFDNNGYIHSLSKHLLDKKLAYVYTGHTKLSEQEQVNILTKI
jgi:endonuclease YncB( thermonuclease family)